MKKNYYEILGVNSDANDTQIKTAFRKLSLLYHPDKQVNKSEEEKKEAEIKFKEINEAYSVLSDPAKRREYDNPNIGGFPGMGGMGGFNPFGPFANFFKYNKDFGANANMSIPGEDVHVSFTLSFEELFNGCQKTISYQYKTRCPNCHGSGGMITKKCPYCNGTGRETVTAQMAYNVTYTSSQPCSHCQATGTIIEKSCPTCGGSGFKTVSDTITFTVPAGMPQNYDLVKEGKGSEARNFKNPNGDLYISCKYDFDTDIYAINNFDVKQKIFIPYYDVLLGTTYVLTLPNKKVKNIKIKPCIANGTIYELTGEGIQSTNNPNIKGDYYVEICYVMPEKLTSEEKSLMQKIKDLNEKRKNDETTENK